MCIHDKISDEIIEQINTDNLSEKGELKNKSFKIRWDEFVENGGTYEEEELEW